LQAVLSRMTCSSASAAGCVWRQEAWNLNEVSAVAQRGPGRSVSLRGIGVVGHAGGHALRPGEDVLRPGQAVLRQIGRHQAGWLAACAVCSCLLSAAVRRNSHSPRRLRAGRAEGVLHLPGVQAEQPADGRGGGQRAGRGRVVWKIL
jgi:hypothetical protein